MGEGGKEGFVGGREVSGKEVKEGEGRKERERGKKGGKKGGKNGMEKG